MGRWGLRTEVDNAAHVCRQHPKGQTCASKIMLTAVGLGPKPASHLGGAGRQSFRPLSVGYVEKAVVMVCQVHRLAGDPFVVPSYPHAVAW